MIFCGYNNRWSCTSLAIIASAIVGVVTAFLQITAVITVTPVFLWVVFGIAVAYLAVTLLATALTRRGTVAPCLCAALWAQLIGLLGSILLSVILLAVGFAATSIVGAIFLGILLFFFALALTSTACYVRCLANCQA